MTRNFKVIITLVLITGLLLAGATGSAFGKEYVIDSDANGLEIRVPAKTQDTGNLNPGDHQYSCLELVNTGTETFTVYIRTNILSESSPRGGKLADVMTLIIKDGGVTVAEDSFRIVADIGNISLGRMSPGSVKTICFFTVLPEDSGNDYQGASFKANWTFLTESSGGGDDPGGGDSGGGTEPSPTPPIKADDEPIPEGEPKPPLPKDPETPVIIVPEEKVPVGPPDMPKTGEALPYPFYLMGAFAILAGLSLAHKKE